MYNSYLKDLDLTHFLKARPIQPMRAYSKVTIIFFITRQFKKVLKDEIMQLSRKMFYKTV